ncbi:SRPBCC domain-containing protein [Flavobacterium sp. MC2016-06]|uniref:SRPBCC family protein n=1 Tax=Flavobacterium sp. MC2016-06 TaxID=2676308 RepID=UPI0012BA5D4D|nr:SRPBCC domain-containing protein [Flavobacterium sp. MC2016-06]MBU3861027.1 SRPBCC domain-containing protein [Flavobacterium sp. MC2016-06]
METNLLMDFTVDKENCLVNVKREFDASLDNVWSAWTEAEILDQWWAPAPFKSETTIMDFKVGGQRLYAMVGPEGEKRWSTFAYTSISPKTNFKHTTTFSDADGNPNSEFGSSYWDITFSKEGDLTLVDIVIKRDSFAELEKIIEMGFKEGFTSALKSLDKIFEDKK